ncbi:MAG TPA: HAD-IIB family hydrolase [Dictyoglomaceae bacterium]|nr:HAD-IIB family hydrolase [Dictyoglomaceae bacterium]HOL38845.1 HAD-IIB family hydrolase [Dictyoglomaceae bacterium]HOP95372.1 HAD-IIB family hydrolase [Dictyoglomaceae bacterium]HPP15738.1 HAD-IIB family hydrolase [Dictyoglomaceae bacterium]HPU44243.1 HAD-IIB family hydrolase [Dictyoglomaceae bacterium]
MYKLLVTDFDGSIVDKDESLSEKNVKAVKKLREAGIDLTLATGRRWSSIKPFAETLEITLPVILYNGAGLFSPTEGRWLFKKSLDKNAIQEVLKIVEKYISDIDVGVYYNDILIRGRDGIEIMRSGKEITKLFIEADPSLLTKLKNEFSDSRVYYNIVFSAPVYLEILPVGASKGKALKYLLSLLKISSKEVIVLGDYDNDLDMFQNTALGITLKNSSEDLKRVADYILDVNPTESIYEIATKILKLNV